MRIRKIFRLGGIVLTILAFSYSSFAFLPPKDVAGPLTLSIADPGNVTSPGKPLSINISLKNSGPTKLDGTVRLAVIDDWLVNGNPTIPFSVEANATQSLSFDVITGKAGYAALYPIHAYADFRSGSANLSAHAILIASVSPSVIPAADTQLPLLTLPKDGRLRLDTSKLFQPAVAIQGVNPVWKPIGWQGVDETTGESLLLQNINRGDLRHALAVHPAWRKGWGDVFVDYRVALPNQSPIALDFATAIRDSSPAEPISDGVEYRVLVKDQGAFKTLFTRFSSAKHWEPAHVDLSAYAGREITLRLVTDPGPAHNTVCDQSYWAELTLAGRVPHETESEGECLARRNKALAQAKDAMNGKSSSWSWKLESEAGVTGASIVLGPSGIPDAFIAFVDGQHELVFDGFLVEVDERAVRAKKTDLQCERIEKSFGAGRGVVTSYLAYGRAPLPVQVNVWAERGALRIAFSMPGVQRNSRGEPRFTALGIGPASEVAHRVYAGFGNVLQDPGRFDLDAGGFTLSTRHIGMDFKNGLSLVEASDIFPDCFRVDPEQHIYSLFAHHDATFTFVPSTHQAFAAAQVYHNLAGFKSAGGVPNLLGRVCLDQWDGDFRRAARDVEMAASYGLTDAVFVKHCWQRWGYDYRLPDIYPPKGNIDDYRAMVDSCKRHGILFSPHDNYIDFYPDATGFSYDHLSFNADGSPQTAWLNKERGAQSYRWSPNAFGPWLKANLKQIKAGFAPTAYFVDVFGAMPPIDFYDRRGHFYPETVTASHWGGAFDRIREILGNNAPTISEAGLDALIGHLDGGESDHIGWRPGTKGPQQFCWTMKAADGERVPWHDMASHGSFVLMGGGLGSRYAGGQDPSLHGYGSDDYLSLTVLGGRNPMCDGPFSRRAVMTYWLLHDVCRSLANSEMLADEFADDDIHRQTVRFSNDGMVHVNRGQCDWTIGQQALPPFGFIAKAGGNEAGITRRGGIISAFAKSKGLLFVDARPNLSAGEGQVLAKVTAVDDLGNRRFRYHINWQVLQPLSPDYKAFVHFVGEKGGDSDDILFQGRLNPNPTSLNAVGTYSSTGEATVPANIVAPAKISIRFGLYNPVPGGRRLPMLGAVDRTGRVRGGNIYVENAAVRWEPEPESADPTNPACSGLNVSGELVDFGFAATNGAFRLICGDVDWQLIPLPDSPPFEVELRLNQLNAGMQKVKAITAVDAEENVVGEAKFQQEGDIVRLKTAAKVFAYRISFDRSASLIWR